MTDTTFSDGAKSFPQAVLTRTYHKSVHVCKTHILVCKKLLYIVQGSVKQVFNFCVENCYVLAIIGKRLKFSV